MTGMLGRERGLAHKDGPRVLLEGVGGIGGVMAARLIAAGHRPALVTGNPGITEAIRRDGVREIVRGQTRAVPAEAWTRLEELPAEARFDAALLVMKATSVVEAARDTVAHLADGGYLVTCQNGIVEDAVAGAVGAARVVSAIVGWGGTMHGPGVCEKTGPGAIHLGELDGALTDRVRRLASVLEAVTPVEITGNIRGALWSKLAINCTITTLGALTGETLGAMLGDRRVRDAFLGLYREVVDTADALGVRLERIAANPRLLYLPAGAGGFKRTVKDLLVRVVGRKYGRLKSSSLQSLERGRPTEIDFLNGYVVEQATRAGVTVPLNTTLVRLIEEIEAGSRPIQKANMDELLRALNT